MEIIAIYQNGKRVTYTTPATIHVDHTLPPPTLLSDKMEEAMEGSPLPNENNGENPLDDAQGSPEADGRRPRTPDHDAPVPDGAQNRPDEHKYDRSDEHKYDSDDAQPSDRSQDSDPDDPNID